MENRSLVTIAEHSKEKILYLLEMAKEFEKKQMCIRDRDIDLLVFDNKILQQEDMEREYIRRGMSVLF